MSDSVKKSLQTEYCAHPRNINHLYAQQRANCIIALLCYKCSVLASTATLPCIYMPVFLVFIFWFNEKSHGCFWIEQCVGTFWSYQGEKKSNKNVMSSAGGPSLTHPSPSAFVVISQCNQPHDRHTWWASHNHSTLEATKHIYNLFRAHHLSSHHPCVTQGITSL